MPRLFDAGQDRETRSIMLALVKPPFSGEYLWRVLGQPYWHGVNIDFAKLIGDNKELRGDADIIGIPAIDGRPAFDSMFAIEVKAYKFDLKDNLKGLGSKLDEADDQADKLGRLGFSRTAILHVLTTENTPERDRGASHGWMDASDRGLAAYDRFRPLLKGRPRRHHVFVWPCGAHPSLAEDEAGAGCPQFMGAPESPAPATQAPSTKTAVIESLKAMIADLPRPPVWGQTPWPTVFGHCRSCGEIIQYYWDGTVCKGCGPIPAEKA